MGWGGTHACAGAALPAPTPRGAGVLVGSEQPPASCLGLCFAHLHHPLRGPRPPPPTRDLGGHVTHTPPRGTLCAWRCPGPPPSPPGGVTPLPTPGDAAPGCPSGRGGGGGGVPYRPTCASSRRGDPAGATPLVPHWSARADDVRPGLADWLAGESVWMASRLLDGAPPGASLPARAGRTARPWAREAAALPSPPGARPYGVAAPDISGEYRVFVRRYT